MTPNDILKGRLAWAVKLRFVVLAVLVGSYILGVPPEEVWRRTGFILSVGAVGFAANGIWLILLRRNALPLQSIALYQCIFDLLVVSLVVYHHGALGAEGYLFVLVILLAGVMLPRRGIHLITFASIFLYFAFSLLETTHVIRPLPPLAQDGGLLPPQVLFLVDLAIKGFFFFLISFACVHLQDLLAKMTNESEFLADFNRQVINMVPIGVVVVDAGRNIVMFNPAMERSAMIESTNAIGKNVRDVFHGLDDSWMDAFDKVENTGEEIRLLGAELPVGSNGKKIRVNVRIQPLKVKEQVLASVCTVQSAVK